MAAFRQAVVAKRHALIAMWMLFGLSQASLAGSHSSQPAAPDSRDAASSPAADTAVADSSTENSAENDSQQLQDLQGVTLEERMRLRMDLRHYSRTSDPVHPQIEDRRRMMNKGIQERFFKADRDDDGLLSRQEVMDSLPQVARHFMQIDLDGDGYISMSELVAFQTQLLERQRAAELRMQERERAMRRAAEAAAAEADAIAAEAANTPAAVTNASTSAEQPRRPRPKSKQAEVDRKPTL